MALSKIPAHLLKRYPLGYNHIVNGNFDFWQKGTSQTNHGSNSDDYWWNSNSGTTKVHSRQAFILGETFPDGTPTPEFYSRTVVTSVAGAANYCLKQGSIPNVRKLAGKKVCLSFYARANTNKKMTIEGLQFCGSEIVYDSKPTTIQLTSVWQKFKILMNFSSLLGKVVTGDTHKTGINFWFDSGSNYNSRNNSLGQQSGTFDLACISLVEGDKDTVVIPRTKAEEFKLCTSMFETMIVVLQRYTASGGWGGTGAVEFPFQSAKYTLPVVTFYADAARTLPGQIIRAGAASPVLASGLSSSVDLNKLLLWNNTTLTTVGWYCYAWVTIDGTF